MKTVGVNVLFRTESPAGFHANQELITWVIRALINQGCIDIIAKSL